MRVTIEQANLLKALNHVHRVVERRNTIPILANVALKAQDGGLHLKATDLDVEIYVEAQAETGEPGETTVPAHMLHEIVRKLPSGGQVELSFQGDATTMEISSGRSQFTLQMLPASDFPDIAASELPHKFEMKAVDLKSLIEHTQFAISNEETRYYLNGIYLHALEDDGQQVLRAVATDGHRLARSQVSAPSGSSEMPGIIVPRKAVAEIQRVVEDPDAAIMIELSDAKIRISAGPVVMTSKLIDGTFPDYNRVIPTANDVELSVDRAEFAKAVDRVSTIASERGRGVKLGLSEGMMKLSANNPDSGTAEEEITASFGASPMEIGFNAKYLLDIAGQLQGENAIFMLKDNASPTLIRDPAAEAALYVLMPMRV